MIDVSLRLEFKGLEKGLGAFAYKQLPFAKAQAVNTLAKRVGAVETANLKSEFPTLTPFTEKSVGIKPARKDDPTALVFVKDTAARYLEPYENRATHYLGAKKGLLVPIDQATNQYGNLPRGTLKRLLGRKDVFVGPVKTKAGIVNGVWQRPYLREHDTSKDMSAGMRRKVRGQGKQPRGANTTGQLRLLIRFKDSPVVRQQLGFGVHARKTVGAFWRADFDAALDQALATAR
jgi:hypothetical protein